MPANNPNLPDGLREWELPELVAAWISRHVIPLAPRTLAEQWPVDSILIQKRRMVNTAQSIAHAEKLLKEAAKQAVRGGKSPARAEQAAA